MDFVSCFSKELAEQPLRKSPLSVVKSIVRSTAPEELAFNLSKNQVCLKIFRTRVKR
jgi:hypothetical protein